MLWKGSTLLQLVHAFVFDDTNVLLHYQFFDEVDWHSQLGVTSVTLVFAPVVLAELDRHKWSGSRREKARATSVLKKIAALGLSTTPVGIRPGVDALALDAEPPDALFAQVSGASSFTTYTRAWGGSD